MTIIYVAKISPHERYSCAMELIPMFLEGIDEREGYLRNSFEKVKALLPENT